MWVFVVKVLIFVGMWVKAWTSGAQKAFKENENA